MEALDHGGRHARVLNPDRCIGCGLCVIDLPERGAHAGAQAVPSFSRRSPRTSARPSSCGRQLRRRGADSRCEDKLKRLQQL
ncbi:MAG: 4Fe-4S binding protein [Desulfobacterales bacterium]|nr:4Fe-4S binding protein [Desulfobacterales bacterium]